MEPTIHRNEARALAGVGLAVLAVLVGMSIAGRDGVLRLAEMLSHDGELASASVRAVTLASSVAPWGAAAAVLALIFRSRLRSGVRRVLGAIETAPARSFGVAVALLALTLRLVWIGLVDSQPTSDFREYFDLAVRLAETGSYTNPDGSATAFRPVGYPALLAGMHLLFGPGLLPAKLLNVGLGAAMVVMLWWFLRGTTGEGAARMAAVLLALFPSHIGYTSLLATELPFATAVLGGLMLCRASEYGTHARAACLGVVLGALLGVAVLLRPTIALFPLVIGLVLWCRVGLARALVVCLALSPPMAAPSVAWGLRNQAALGAFVPTPTSGGVNFYFGNNTVTSGSGFEMLDPRRDLTSGIRDEVARSREGYRLGATFWREHPARAMQLAVRKAALMMLSDSVWTAWAIHPADPPLPDGTRWVVNAIANAWWWILMPAWLVEALVFRWRRGARAFAPVWFDGLAAYTIVTTAAFMGQERYHFVLLPAVCAGAALLVARLAGEPGPASG